MGRDCERAPSRPRKEIMPRVSNLLQYTQGTQLTAAAWQQGPVYQSHAVRKKQTRGNNLGFTCWSGANQTTLAAAIAAGSYAKIKLTGGKLDLAYLTEIRLGFFKPATELNARITLLTSFEDEPEYADQLQQWNWTTNSTSATGTWTGEHEFYPSDYQHIYAVIWNMSSAASTVGINSSTYVRYEYDSEEFASNFPQSTDSFRDVENRPGVIYDPAKKTSVFAEDMITRGDAIQGIEQAIGVMPSQTSTTVAGNINKANMVRYFYWLNSTGANTGTFTLTGEPMLYRTVDGYRLVGTIGGRFSTTSGTTAYLYTDIRDFVPTESPFWVVNDNTGAKVPVSIVADQQNGRFILNLTTNMHSAGFIGSIDVLIPRQVELWQMGGAGLIL